MAALHPIQLTEEEIFWYSVHGVKTHIHHVLRGSKNRYGAQSEDGWGLDIERCLSEKAVANYLGVDYNGGTIGVYTEKDVAGFYQVRVTKHKTGKLILHQEDLDDDVFIFVIGQDGTYDIRKWCYAWEGKQERWWSDPKHLNRHAFFVPEKVLHSMDILPPVPVLEPAM